MNSADNKTAGEIVIEDDGWRTLKLLQHEQRIDLLAFVFEMNDYMSKLDAAVPLGVGVKMFLDDRLKAEPGEISAFMAQRAYNQLMTAAEELQKKDQCSRLADSQPIMAGQSGSTSELESLPGLSLGVLKTATG